MAKYRNDLTFQEVHGQLAYDPISGHFSWRVQRRYGLGPGSRAGSLGDNGYRRIKLCRNSYCEHRLAWLLMNEKWPEQEIDHVNMNRSDNRYANLRIATHTQNNANRRASVVGRLKGVTYIGHICPSKPWKAQIAKNKEKIYLGCFTTELAAHKVYQKAAEKLFGSYARTV